MTGRPGKVCSRERYNLTYIVKDDSGRCVENRLSEGKKGVRWEMTVACLTTGARKMVGSSLNRVPLADILGE